MYEPNLKLPMEIQFLAQPKIFATAQAASKTYTTVCFRDLAKLNLPMVVRFKLEPIFDTAPVASKNKARFKSGQS
jgi:hypothetical protein